jgi:hypothetical protein
MRARLTGTAASIGHTGVEAATTVASMVASTDQAEASSGAEAGRAVAVAGGGRDGEGGGDGQQRQPERGDRGAGNRPGPGVGGDEAGTPASFGDGPGGEQQCGGPPAGP